MMNGLMFAKVGIIKVIDNFKIHFRGQNEKYKLLEAKLQEE
ncbi:MULTISPECIES: hypothetical protein [Clostridium]|nr:MULTISPECIES: hypothetical protein [Clostridium]NOW91070.1 hypothetical protein [Clostridium beijerinckii]